ncbi:hypothetical protein DFH07DRAFT_805184 [Mycena maculata]|uniref:HIT domain-containing protein n=1 Tax=Mycena maculata TaxID=230809 RepID=A0AAD7NQF3_9AGAR|nr:hypothetical protein DFH07DRAFT_805184 [Mycena maculata]
MSFASKPGCPMCGIVSMSMHGPSHSPRSPSFPVGSTQPEILWRDDNFTAYREKANPVSSKGHVIVAFNLHVPSIYTLSATDLPLLVNIRNLATRLLTSLLPPSSPASAPISASTSAPLQRGATQFKIGFITPPFYDTKIPVKDHLHCHAYIGPPDLMGWMRGGFGYGPLAWYAIDDLIAEIRESTTNNRIKSGHANRPRAPIDMVPHAGARTGTADGIETTEPGLANPDADLEDGQGTPTATPRTATLSPQNSIPSIRV